MTTPRPRPNWVVARFGWSVRPSNRALRALPGRLAGARSGSGSACTLVSAIGIGVMPYRTREPRPRGIASRAAGGRRLHVQLLVGTAVAPARRFSSDGNEAQDT